MNGKKVIMLVGGIFFGVGILLIGIACLVSFISKDFYKTAVKTEAVIEEIDAQVKHRGGETRRTYDVYISYYAEDEYYSHQRIGFYTNSMYEGKSIEVWYNPDNPRDVRVKASSKVAVVILSVLGGIFFLTGGGLLICGRKKQYLG